MKHNHTPLALEVEVETNIKEIILLVILAAIVITKTIGNTINTKDKGSHVPMTNIPVGRIEKETKTRKN